jgi:hypothetical protein
VSNYERCRFVSTTVAKIEALSRYGSPKSGSGSSASLFDDVVVVLALGGVGLLVSLVRAVDGDLDGDFASLNLLAVHLSNSLLLLLLRGQGDETEATALAGLTASLELLDHETGNGAKSDLGRRRLVGREELLQL